MKNIKVLDCTLRDGGYVNDWNFGFENSKNIISLLNKSLVDFIEIGYLDKNNSSKDKTLYPSIQEINDFITDDLNIQKLVLMITFSTFPIEYVPKVEYSKIKKELYS